MNGRLRLLFGEIFKWAASDEDSISVMARTIIGAAKDVGMTSAELHAAIEWHLKD